MNRCVHYGLVFLGLLIANKSYTCPYIIHNDSKEPVIVVDPYNKQAIYVTHGQKQQIDPSISGWRYYFYSEKLDIYVPQHDHEHLFYRKYQLVEKYCTEGVTEISVSDIADLVNKPEKRYQVHEFEPHESTAHTHT